MIIKSIRAPKVPSSNDDPIGAEREVRKAERQINKRIARCKDEIIALFNRIPVMENNATATQEKAWAYLFDTTSAAMLAEETQRIIDKFLLDGVTIQSISAGTADFWQMVYLEDAMLAGTAQANMNLTYISSVYASERQLTQILNSPAYQERLKAAFLRSYEDWTALTARTRRDLAQVITENIAKGSNSKVVANIIKERLDVTKSLADNIAQTEITGTLRLARLNEAEDARASLNLDVRFFWTSALLPTTRFSHANRHGKTYTDEQVRDFYSRDGNRYRCHCAITEVIFVDGKAELPKGMKERYAETRKEWERKAQKTAS